MDVLPVCLCYFELYSPSISDRTLTAYRRPLGPIIDRSRTTCSISSWSNRWLVHENGILVDKVTLETIVAPDRNQYYGEDLEADDESRFRYWSGQAGYDRLYDSTRLLSYEEKAN